MIHYPELDEDSLMVPMSVKFRPTTTKLRGYSLVLIPLSWAFGVWRKPHKTIFALGPFRLAIHHELGKWRAEKKTCGYVGPCGWQEK